MSVSIRASVNQDRQRYSTQFSSKMSQSTCRWAALSLSNIASVFLPDILLPHGDLATDSISHKLVAVSTTGSRERASKWLSESKTDESSIKVYSSWEMMLKVGDFDIVYISTPHPLHFEHVRKALEYKRNVLVEKPATMTMAQYKELAEYAVEQNVVLMEAMWVSDRH
jgi:dihydrodiol dehydrogenase / D-xylose 1-dehydrogenase (NADP)